MITTTPATPAAPIAHPNSYRVGYLTTAIELLPDDSPAKATLLAAIDACEADIIRDAHTHGVELDSRARAAMHRMLTEGQATA
jgi:hypothetical protein